MNRKTSLLALSLTLALAPMAFAGGENCAHKTAAAHKEKTAQLAAKGWNGMKTEKDAAGAYRVASVAPDSPAAQAGLRTGDVLVAMNGIALTDANKEALKKAKANLGVGKQVSYTVRRAGAEQTLAVTLAPVPQEILAEWVKEEEARTQVAQSGN